jgi:plasmid stabilization system protein ParE
MAYSLEWTLNSQKELNQIYDYLEENWTDREIRKFSINLDDTLNLLCKFPFIYQASEHNQNIRRCVLSKQTSIYYYVDVKNESITILSLFDNRQNPDKLNFI